MKAWIKISGIDEVKTEGGIGLRGYLEFTKRKTGKLSQFETTFPEDLIEAYSLLLTLRRGLRSAESSPAAGASALAGTWTFT